MKNRQDNPGRRRAGKRDGISGSGLNDPENHAPERDKSYNPVNKSSFGADESRPPMVTDLVGLCRRLNEAGAKYIVIGGMAVVQHGFVRATEDIDLLVDVSSANQERIRTALMGLPDGAVKDLKQDDLNAYMVVRVADEIVVDLMKSANGIEYHEASAGIDWVEIQGVRIPFAGLRLLWRLKQTVREKDALDRMFLKERMKNGKQSAGGVGTMDPRRSGAAEGVALIMVLGVLSLMLLLAVSFAISMRTERLAAGNYADAVRARQLVHVALARAMDDICRNLGTNLWNPSGKVYPSWAVTNSYSINWTRLNTNTLLYGQATNFVPRALWTEATNADFLESSNHWIEIRAVNEVGGGSIQTNLVGRVGYLILNCSGLLDANYAGGQQGGGLVPRRVGTNPNEIAIANLEEIGATANAISFLNNRINNVRYETLHELKELNPAIYSGGTYPSNFFVYSYFPAGYWQSSGLNASAPVNLAGSVGDLAAPARQSAILSAFTNAGFSASEAGVLYNNLIDYVDGDSIPGNETTCVEAVPMINEIVVSNAVVDLGGNNYQMNTTLSFELWYPFVYNSASTFELQYKADFTDMAGAGFVPTDIIAWKSLAPTVTPGAQSFAVMNDPLSFIITAPGGINVNFISRIDARVVLLAGGQVDNVASIALTNQNVVSISSAECLDPRFNRDPPKWQSAPYATLTNINPSVTNYWANNPSLDTDSAMVVANQSLRSVGELGVLAYAPWQTVKLYGPNLGRVLDVFAMGTNAADVTVTQSRRGLVNPNSKVTNALAAVFADMPVDEYPGGPSNRLSMADARILAQRLILNRYYTNGSDIGRGLTDFSGLGVVVSTELQKESFFRNTGGLLSARQNLFTIIIEAQAASGGSLPRNLARQRAVAVVWRDPYTGEFFVRSLKWLED